MSNKLILGFARSMRARSASVALVAALVLAVGSASAYDADAPVVRATPESVGMSSERLEKITAAFDKEVAAKRLPGAVVMVTRKGRLVYARTFGARDPKAVEPMRADSIFRIYSMTKPFVSVAAMMLVEDGALQLGDPVSKWLLAFKDLKVSTGSGDAPLDRPMTVYDLLRHTAGLTYGEITQHAGVRDALAKAGLFKPGVMAFDVRDMSGAEQVERLAKVPLVHQPGTTFEYSLASDVLGRVVEAVSGQRLGAFLQARLFGPLKMKDTGFYLPDRQKGRLAEPFEHDPIAGTPIRLIDVSKEPGNDSGGAGSVSTAGDYLRFEQMLLNGGVLDGVRILSRSSVKLMTADHLGARIPNAPTPGGQLLSALGYTFGLGFAVRPADGLARLPGSAGDYSWGGYAGTGFWIDPQEALTAVFMVQQTGALVGYHRSLIRQLVYQAIAD